MAKVATNNLSKAQVTRDSSGPATCQSCAACDKIIMHFKGAPIFEASVQKTP